METYVVNTIRNSSGGRTCAHTDAWATVMWYIAHWNVASVDVYVNGELSYRINVHTE